MTRARSRVRNIVVGCGKGGVAKTTTAVSLACYLARGGFCTLLIDGDAQGDSSDAFGLAPEPGLSAWVGAALLASTSSASRHIRPVPGVPGISILSGDSHTARLENTLSSNNVPVDFLQRLAAHDDEISAFDYVVWDTPASGRLMEMILHLADLIVAPVQPGQLDIRGLSRFMKMASDLTSAPVRILPTLFRRTDNICPANVDNIIAAWPQNVISPEQGEGNSPKVTAFLHNGALVIPERVAIRRSQGYGISIFEHSPNDDAAHAYAALGCHVTAHFGEGETL